MSKDWKETLNDFKCKICNFPLIIYEIQAKRNITIFKAKCPAHGLGNFKIPTGGVSNLIPVISDRVFRCFSCGAPSRLDQMVDKDVWKVIKVNCPIHGSSRSYKFNFHVFSEVLNYVKKGTPKKPDEDKPPKKGKAVITREEIQFCRECGVKLKPDYVFCNKCGTKIIKTPLKKEEIEQNYCGVCGSPIDHGYHFCIRCGARI